MVRNEASVQYLEWSVYYKEISAAAGSQADAPNTLPRSFPREGQQSLHRYCSIFHIRPITSTFSNTKTFIPICDITLNAFCSAHSRRSQLRIKICYPWNALVVAVDRKNQGSNLLKLVHPVCMERRALFDATYDAQSPDHTHAKQFSI